MTLGLTKLSVRIVLLAWLSAALLILWAFIGPSVVDAYRRRQNESEQTRAAAALRERMLSKVGRKTRIVGRLVFGKSLYIEQSGFGVNVLMNASEDREFWNNLDGLEGKVVEARGTLYYGYSSFYLKYPDLTIRPAASLSQ